MKQNIYQNIFQYTCMNFTYCVYLVGFVMCEAAPSTQNFASKVYSPHDPKSFLKAVRKEVHCRFLILF